MKTVTIESRPIDKIKGEILSSIGKTITIEEHNKQGKLLHQYIGEIISAHDNVFLVKVNLRGYSLNKSFTYVDFSIGELSYNIN